MRDELAVVDEPKLKLGVGDDESARGYVLRGCTTPVRWGKLYRIGLHR
jgi:hypothetical protein